MGILIGGKTPQSIEIGGKAVQSLAIGGEVVWSAVSQIPDYMRLKNISNESGVFKMVKTGSPTAPNLEYSLDGTTWTTYDFTTIPEIQVAAGETIYFRGTNSGNYFNYVNWQYWKFSFDKTCEGHGNMCSLFNPDPTVFSTINYIGECGLFGLFNGCTALTTAPDLSSVTSIGNRGLSLCFNGCTALTTAPDLSSVTSIGNYGLSFCFNGCTALTTAPDLSSVTSIGDNGIASCFTGCNSLTTAPDLSSVTSIGANSLYECFKDCWYLTAGPDLSSVTSVRGSALGWCFNSCYRVNVVTAPNISDLTADRILDNWLMGTGSVQSGTTRSVRVPTGATIDTNSYSGIAPDWTRVDY